MVTAKVTTLEDLRDIPPGLFDTEATGGDVSLLRTEEVEETSLRKNLLPMEPVEWPALKDGPLEGAITTKIVVDRTGKVRELGSILSDNPGLSEAAGKTIGSMQFKPYLQDGMSVQVVSRITMPFKTVRPAGVETFDSAHNYFERGRHVSFPAAGNGQAYILHATFQVKVAAGTIENGQYMDTWKSDDEWRREATIGKSRFIRARHGEIALPIVRGPGRRGVTSGAEGDGAHSSHRHICGVRLENEVGHRRRRENYPGSSRIRKCGRHTGL